MTRAMPVFVLKPVSHVHVLSFSLLAGAEAGEEFMPAFWEQVSPDPSFEEMEALVCAPRSERPPLDHPRLARDPVRAAHYAYLAAHLVFSLCTHH